MQFPPVIVDNVAKGMNVGHKLILKLSGGRLLKDAFGMPTVELHTTGRRSGQRRSVILTTPVRSADRVVLVASKGGDARHPEWYRNLVADPAVELTMDGVTRPWRARTAEGAEREELWPQIVAAYKGYEAYQRNTDRVIPVVVLEPA